MSMVDASLGLRASKLFGLRWEDFDWKALRVKIQGSWVYGRIEATKTEGSEKWLPLDSNLAELLLRHREKMPDELLKAVVGAQSCAIPSSTRCGEGWHRSNRVAYFPPHVFDFVARLRDGHEVSTRIAEALGHSNDDGHLYAHSVRL
jgi:integrase